MSKQIIIIISKILIDKKDKNNMYIPSQKILRVNDIYNNKNLEQDISINFLIFATIIMNIFKSFFKFVCFYPL